MNNLLYNPLVSVIVPIHNSETYLEDTLESLAKQTYNNLEILLIDDGSTDNSGLICDKYANKYSRFRVFHTTNKGVSSARNIGLENCSGIYIGFVDSDDIVEPDFYLKLVYGSECGKHDIVQCSYRSIDLNNKTLDYYEYDEILDKKPFEKYTLYPHKLISNSVWNKIFRKSIVSEIRFDVSLSIGEDFKFVVEALSISNSVKLINYIGYLYYFRENSTMASSFRTIYFDDLIINDWLFDKYNNNYEMLKSIKARDAECCLKIYCQSVIFKSNKQKIIMRLRKDKNRYPLCKKHELFIYLILHFSIFINIIINIKYMFFKKREFN